MASSTGDQQISGDSPHLPHTTEGKESISNLYRCGELSEVVERSSVPVSNPEDVIVIARAMLEQGQCMLAHQYLEKTLKDSSEQPSSVRHSLELLLLYSEVALCRDVKSAIQKLRSKTKRIQKSKRLSPLLGLSLELLGRSLGIALTWQLLPERSRADALSALQEAAKEYRANRETNLAFRADLVYAQILGGSESSQAKLEEATFLESVIEEAQQAKQVKIEILARMKKCSIEPLNPTALYQLEQQCRNKEYASELAQLFLTRGMLLQSEGQDARNDLINAARHFQEQGISSSEYQARSLLAQLLLAMGNPAAGLTELNRAKALAEEMGNPLFLVSIFSLLSDCYLRVGKTSHAKEYALKAFEHAQGSPGMLSLSSLSLAQQLTLIGEAEKAQKLSGECLEHLKKASRSRAVSSQLSMAYLVHGNMLLEAKNFEAADRTFRVGMKIDEQSGDTGAQLQKIHGRMFRHIQQAIQKRAFFSQYMKKQFAKLSQKAMSLIDHGPKTPAFLGHRIMHLRLISQQKLIHGDYNGAYLDAQKAMEFAERSEITDQVDFAKAHLTLIAQTLNDTNPENS